MQYNICHICPCQLLSINIKFYINRYLHKQVEYSANFLIIQMYFMINKHIDVIFFTRIISRSKLKYVEMESLKT